MNDSAAVQPDLDVDLKPRGSRMVVVIALVLGLGVLGAVGWFVYRGYLWVPSPAQICDRLDELGNQPSMPISIGGESPVAGSERQQCEWYYGALRGNAPDFGKIGRCIMAASDGRDAINCEYQ